MIVHVQSSCFINSFLSPCILVYYMYMHVCILPPSLPISLQVKNVYVRLLYNCYVDSGLDNKEMFAKDHMWTLFTSSITDIDRVTQTHTHTHTH